MTFDVLQSVHATITRFCLRYIHLSLICVWLQGHFFTLFAGSTLKKHIRDHLEKRLHYPIEFFWGDGGNNAVKDHYVPVRDRYPHSNPMMVLVVHWRIYIINIHTPTPCLIGKMMVYC